MRKPLARVCDLSALMETPSTDASAWLVSGPWRKGLDWSHRDPVASDWIRCSDQRSEQLFTINYNIFFKIVWLSVNKTDQIFRLNWYVAFLVCKSPEDVATTTKANIASDLVVDFQSDHRSNVLTKTPSSA